MTYNKIKTEIIRAKLIKITIYIESGIIYSYFCFKESLISLGSLRNHEKNSQTYYGKEKNQFGK